MDGLYSRNYRSLSRSFRHGRQYTNGTINDNSTSSYDTSGSTSKFSMSYTARKYSSNSNSYRSSGGSSYKYSSAGRKSVESDAPSSGRSSSERSSSEKWSDRSSSLTRNNNNSNSRCNGEKQNGYSSSSSSLSSGSSGYSSYNGNSTSSNSSSNGYSSSQFYSTYSGRHKVCKISRTSADRYSSENGEQSGSYSNRQTPRTSPEVTSANGRYSSCHNSCTDLQSSSQSYVLPSTFINGYTTLDRRLSRRKKEMNDRSSAERTVDSSNSSSSLNSYRSRLKKYARSSSCDNATHDYSSLPDDYNSKASTSLENLAPNSYSYRSPRSCRKSSSPVSAREEVDETSKRISSLCPSISVSTSNLWDKEKSPSIMYINEGLAKVNEALEKHKTDIVHVVPSTSYVTGNHTTNQLSLSSNHLNSYNNLSSSTNHLDYNGIDGALRGATTSKIRAPRGRLTNNGNSSYGIYKSANVQSDSNLTPDITVPVSFRLIQIILLRLIMFKYTYNLYIIYFSSPIQLEFK